MAKKVSQLSMSYERGTAPGMDDNNEDRVDGEYDVVVDGDGGTRVADFSMRLDYLVASGPREHDRRCRSPPCWRLL